MRRKVLFYLSVLFCMVAYSQENPNRMIIHQSSGIFRGFLAERVDSITFVELEGRVATDIEITDVRLDGLTVNLTRTPECQSFKLACFPRTVAGNLTNDAVAADYIEGQGTEAYQEDFSGGNLEGISLESNSEYVLMTLGIDKYGIPCGVTRASFKTPQKPLVGDPKVTTTVTDIKQREFTASFVPNKDVDGYAAVAAEKGTMQEQYEMFGPMFGFHNFGDMIKTWGETNTGASSFTWREMEPGTEYEIFVQAWDEEGTYAEVDITPLTTQMKGGAGNAVVSITPGEYKLADWDGEMKPSLFISFTPNEQASCYRYGVYLASIYDEDPQGVQSDIRMDPPAPTAHWFQYDPLTTDFQIDPDTEVVAVAAAKNGEGAWGECTVLRFTTPNEVSGTSARAFNGMKGNTIRQRVAPVSRWSVGAGKMPELPLRATGMRLSKKKCEPTRGK